jgi:hypothetical protein
MKYILIGEYDYISIKIKDDMERTYTLFNFDGGRILRWFGLYLSPFKVDYETRIREDIELE